MSILAKCATIPGLNGEDVRQTSVCRRLFLQDRIHGDDKLKFVGQFVGQFVGRLPELLIYDLLKRYGLWAVFFGTMIEGDLTLLFSGVLARAGLFTFEEALIVGTAGGFIGDSLSYMVGARFRGRARSWHFFTRARPRVEKLMHRFGVLSVFIVKYVYGLRTTSAIFYGLVHFGFLRFAALTLASCVVWVGVLAGLGFTFATGIEKLVGDLKRIQIILLVVVIIIATVYIISRFERRVIEEEKEFFAREEEEDE